MENKKPDSTNISTGEIILYASISLLVFGAIFYPEDTKRVLNNVVECMNGIEKVSVSAKNTTENAKIAYDNMNYICHQ